MERKFRIDRLLFCIAGGILYAVGVNMFIVPFGLYSGGIVGIAQLVRTLLADYIHLDFGSKDVPEYVYRIEPQSGKPEKNPELEWCAWPG